MKFRDKRNPFLGDNEKDHKRRENITPLRKVSLLKALLAFKKILLGNFTVTFFKYFYGILDLRYFLDKINCYCQKYDSDGIFSLTI